MQEANTWQTLFVQQLRLNTCTTEPIIRENVCPKPIGKIGINFFKMFPNLLPLHNISKKLLIQISPVFSVNHLPFSRVHRLSVEALKLMFCSLSETSALTGLFPLH